LEAIDGSALACQSTRPIVVDSANTHFTVVDRTLMNITRTSVIHYFGDESDIALDSMVEELGAFSFCWKTMTTFTLVDPSRLRVIARSAFYWCKNLASIVLPSTVEVIERGAFNYCSALQLAVFAAGSRLGIIEEEAFSYCHYLQPVDVPASAKISGDFQVLAEVTDLDRSRLIRGRFYTPALRL
jgi:hypothetical protein